MGQVISMGDVELRLVTLWHKKVISKEVKDYLIPYAHKMDDFCQAYLAEAVDYSLLMEGLHSPQYQPDTGDFLVLAAHKYLLEYAIKRVNVTYYERNGEVELAMIYLQLTGEVDGS